ncbi:hypothetical protein AMK27_37300 [Streptomyces sp. CB02009]|nr:hypothetical protein AMK27_37300 [Streptomyces sp. CB02009]
MVRQVPAARDQWPRAFFSCCLVIVERLSLPRFFASWDRSSLVRWDEPPLPPVVAFGQSASGASAP